MPVASVETMQDTVFQGIVSDLDLITKYSSTLYIGMDKVLALYACTFENSDLHFYFH